jgi:hypothetical protein
MANTGGNFLTLQPIVFRSSIVSIGDLATDAAGPLSTVVGPGCTSTLAAERSISHGHQCAVRGPDSVVLGQSCQTTGLGEKCVLLGNNVTAVGTIGGIVAIGRDLIHTGSSGGSYVELVSIGAGQTVLVDYVDSVMIGHNNFLTGSAGGTDNVCVGHGNQITGASISQIKNTALGSTNIVRGSNTSVVGHDNSTGTSTSFTHLLGGTISVGDGSVQVVGLGCNLTVSAPPGTPFSNVIVVGCNNSTSSGGGGDTVIMIGNNLNHGGAGNVSRNILMGDDDTSAGCTNTGSIGHNHSLTDCTDVFAYGGTVAFGGGSANSLGLGITLTVGTNTSLGIYLGTSLSVGNNALKCIVVGNNITLPANSVAVVVLGDGAYASNASVAIGQSATVGFGGVGGNGCVAIGALTTIGTAANNSASVANSSVGNDSGGSLAIVNSNVGNTSPSCAALANSSVGNTSNVCVAIGSSTVGIGCRDSFAAVSSTIAAAAESAIAIIGACTGSHSVALSNATAAANEFVAGGSLLVNSFRTFRIKGFNAVSLDLLAAIDTPSAGDTGLTVIYNDGVSTTNKTLRAAASPPVGALLLYVDP